MLIVFIHISIQDLQIPQMNLKGKQYQIGSIFGRTNCNVSKDYIILCCNTSYMVLDLRKSGTLYYIKLKLASKSGS